MSKYELYTAIGLITIIIISVLWKQELKYRRSFINIEYQTEPRLTSEIKPDTIRSGYLGKRKPSGKGWMEAYSDGIHFNYKPKWNPK